MKPSPCLMTGSRANLASIGRLDRGPSRRPKRRRLDIPDDVHDEDVLEDPVDEGSGRDRDPLTSASSPLRPPHGVDHACPSTASGTTSVPRWTPSCRPGDVWWPTVFGEASSSSHRLPVQDHVVQDHVVQDHVQDDDAQDHAQGRPVARMGRASKVGRAGCLTGGRGGHEGHVGQESDGGYSSQDSCGSDAPAPAGTQNEQDWSRLPPELLVEVFKLLRLRDLGRIAQVCRGWRRASQEPCLWRTAEFVLGSSVRPGPTPPSLVNFILEEHAQHLKFVVLRTDSSAESARGACRILARLVKCSLKTLALMSGATRPSLLDVDVQQFASALTLVLDHSSPSLRALAVDNTLVDDPSLQALAGVGSNSATSLQLLRCKSCPRLSPGGVLALVDYCRCLRELSLSYTLLSDDLLTALSSERHVCLEVLRVDVYSDSENALRPIAPSSWRALVAHSPQLNLVMYFFAIQDESFDGLFTSYIPVTHLYFGDYVPTSVLSRVGAFCPRLVELVVGANGNSIIDKQLLAIATNCQHLSSLGLAECQVTCSALVQLAQICGPRLTELVVMEECLIEDSVHDLASTCARVSQILGRDWTPEFMPLW